VVLDARPAWRTARRLRTYGAPATTLRHEPIMAGGLAVMLHRNMQGDAKRISYAEPCVLRFIKSWPDNSGSSLACALYGQHERDTFLAGPVPESVAAGRWRRRQAEDEELLHPGGAGARPRTRSLFIPVAMSPGPRTRASSSRWRWCRGRRAESVRHPHRGTLHTEVREVGIHRAARLHVHPGVAGARAEGESLFIPVATAPRPPVIGPPWPAPYTGSMSATLF